MGFKLGGNDRNARNVAGPGRGIGNFDPRSCCLQPGRLRNQHSSVAATLIDCQNLDPVGVKFQQVYKLAEDCGARLFIRY